MITHDGTLTWLRNLQAQLDPIINSTPTGNCRIALCNVKIFLQLAIATFEEKVAPILEGGA